MIRPDFRPHQLEALELTKDRPNAGFYLGMGLGKTFVATERMLMYGTEYNLCICQNSKVDEWVEHFRTYTDLEVTDFTKPKAQVKPGVIVINYELAWRRNALYDLKDFTLVLDESSVIQHKKTKQTKFVMSLRPKHVILASGTMCNGKYENLWTQIKLMGAPINETYFWNRYIDYDLADNVRWVEGTLVRGRPYRKVKGYKNIEELKLNLRRLGCVFMLTEDVLDLPPVTEQIIRVKATPEYRRFVKNKAVTIDGIVYKGDTTLTKRLRERQLCSFLSKPKLDALSDLLDSTEERLVIFYNFQEEFIKISQLCEIKGKKISFCNGMGKDQRNYDNEENSVMLVQYTSGAKGLNLQAGYKLVMLSLPEGAENFSQAKGRIWRDGQVNKCTYYFMITEDSIEEVIWESVSKGEDFTMELYREYDNGRGKEL